jgi:hypothetical protein
VLRGALVLAAVMASGAAAAGGPVASPVVPADLAGPVPDLAAVCSGEERAAGCTGESPFERGRTRYKGLRAPWREVVLYAGERTDRVGYAECRIAVRLADGWWSGPLAESCQSYGETGGAPHFFSRVRSVRVSQLVPGGSRELLVRIERERSERGEAPDGGGGRGVEFQREELFVVCGIGGDAVPRCTPAITTRYSGWVDWERGRETMDRWRLAVDWRGGLRIRYRGRGGPGEEAAALLGVHALSFDGEEEQ